MKILGYRLKNLPVEKIEMPRGSRIVCALDLNGEPNVFAVIDPAVVETESRTVYCVTTGKVFDERICRQRYLGSFAVANYGIVYHFYEDANSEPVAEITVAHIAKEAEPESPQANP